MKKILFISVHPDDETLGAGGTILKHKSMGDKIYWLIITKATENIRSCVNIIEEQNRYIKEVALRYSFNAYHQLNFNTIELEKYPTSMLINEISKVLVDIEPEIIYFQHFADVHTDHRIAFDAIYSCTKNFRFPFIKRILLFETLSETEFAPAVRNNAFVPNVFVDITEYLEKKIKIMELFTTEQMNEPLPRALSTIEALARYRGSRIGVRYAEAFTLIFEML